MCSIICRKPSNISSKSVKNENFDDLLEEMLLKQDKKKSKKKISEAPSVIDKR